MLNVIEIFNLRGTAWFLMDLLEGTSRSREDTATKAWELLVLNFSLGNG
jgi:hypothetical protein